MKQRKSFSKFDGIFIFMILSIAFIFYYFYEFWHPDKELLVGEILIDGQVIASVALDQEQIFSLDIKPNVIFEVKNQGIAFHTSDCPDQVCVRSGLLKQTGEVAACLPNHVAIRIVRPDKTLLPEEPDIILQKYFEQNKSF